MTGYEITYRRTGSGEKKKLDRVMIWENDPMEFETGTVTAHNLCEIIDLFEMIAAKYWGTYETKHSIEKIERIEVK